LIELAEAKLPVPACNQIELHPMGQKADLVAYMKSKGIQPVAYSSLVPLSTWREGYKKYGGSIASTDKETPSPVKTISDRLRVSEAQVLLRWAIQKGFCILPKSTNETRIAQNIDLACELTHADMQTLDAMESNTAAAFGEPGKPFDPTVFEA